MKSKWSIILCLALGGLRALAPASATAADERKPTVEIPEKIHDIGKVFPKEYYIHTFVVRNVGKADLVIAGVKPG